MEFQVHHQFPSENISHWLWLLLSLLKVIFEDNQTVALVTLKIVFITLICNFTSKIGIGLHLSMLLRIYCALTIYMYLFFKKCYYISILSLSSSWKFHYTYVSPSLYIFHVSSLHIFPQAISSQLWISFLFTKTVKN